MCILSGFLSTVIFSRFAFLIFWFFQTKLKTQLDLTFSEFKAQTRLMESDCTHFQSLLFYLTFYTLHSVDLPSSLWLNPESEMLSNDSICRSRHTSMYEMNELLMTFSTQSVIETDFLKGKNESQPLPLVFSINQSIDRMDRHMKKILAEKKLLCTLIECVLVE